MKSLQLNFVALLLLFLFGGCQIYQINSKSGIEEMPMSVFKNKGQVSERVKCLAPGEYFTVKWVRGGPTYFLYARTDNGYLTAQWIGEYPTYVEFQLIATGDVNDIFSKKHQNILRQNFWITISGSDLKISPRFEESKASMALLEENLLARLRERGAIRKL